MRNAVVVVALVALFAMFAVSSALFVYVAVFWFRADWFQVFVLCVFGLSAWASWNALGMISEWGTNNAK
jgi:hypothetical protein